VAAGRVEFRPAARVAHLAVRSLACPSCGVPVAVERPLGFSDDLFCDFCEESAPTREYVRDWGWPQVDLIARI
jgi:hypothetical protein